jgi:OFA family oxalate/formate antiporter-like MFS transporter
MIAQQRTDAGGSRWLILVACIFAMLAIANLQYAWTLFTTPLREDLGASLVRIQWAFTIFVIAQTGLFPFTAYLIERIGPRIIVSIASLLVAIGWVGAGVAGLDKSVYGLYVAYGLGGIGAGAVYGACVGAAMKWFPDRRGLCVGFVAGSYGFGTALTAFPIAHMIKATGYQSAFIIWGLIQGIVVLIAAQFLMMPPDGWAPAGWEQIKHKVHRKVQQSTRNYTPREMLKSRPFYILYIMMTLVTFSGLMLTAQLKPIGEQYGLDKYILVGSGTVLSLVMNQVLNGSARPFFGWLSDHIGRYDTMGLTFIIGAIAMTALTILVRYPVWFVVACGMTFFAWGDIYSLFPAAIADIFGNKHATTNYGIQYTAKGVGAILAGPCAAWLMAKYDSWLPVFWLAVACNVIAAALAVLWLKPLIVRLMIEQTSEKARETTPEPADEQAASASGSSAK